MSSKTQQKLLIIKKENISYVNMSKSTCLSTRFVLSTMQRYAAFQVGKKEPFYQNVKVDIGPRFP